MKKFLIPITLMANLIFAPDLWATTRPLIKGGVCISDSFKGKFSLFACEHIGQVTINQIYEQGWKVVNTYSPSRGASHTTFLIIEQQEE